MDRPPAPIIANAERKPLTDTATAPDRCNLALIVLAFLLLVLLLPPARNYLATDEGIYLPTLRDFLATHVYTRPDLTQANLVGLIWLGAGWSALFGFNLTAISGLMLLLSLLTLLGFYLLLRELEVAPNVALFGVALLGLNPLYLHISYIFITDIPFLGLMFYACLCYLRWLRGKGEGWLWLGGGLVAYDFLIRQYAALIPCALLLYLALSGRWRWRIVVASLLPFALVAAAFLWWQSGQPLNRGTAEQIERVSGFLFMWSWPLVVAGRMVSHLPLLGLFTLPRLTMQRRWLLLGWGVIVTLIALFANFYPDRPILVADPLSVNGSLLGRDGFTFARYVAPPVLTDAGWNGLLLLGGGLGVLLLAQLTADGLEWWPRFVADRRQTGPVIFIYILGLLIFIVTYAFNGLSFDRYILGYLPLLLIFLLRGGAGWGRWAWGYLLAGLLLLGIGGVLMQADYADHNTARFAAADWLLAQGVAPRDIWLDSEWARWYQLGGEGGQQYLIREYGHDRYHLVKSFPYFSRLGGFSNRAVEVWQRNPDATTTSPTPVHEER